MFGKWLNISLYIILITKSNGNENDVGESNLNSVEDNAAKQYELPKWEINRNADPKEIDLQNKIIVLSRAGSSYAQKEKAKMLIQMLQRHRFQNGIVPQNGAVVGQRDPKPRFQPNPDVSSSSSSDNDLASAGRKQKLQNYIQKLRNRNKQLFSNNNDYAAPSVTPVVRTTIRTTTTMVPVRKQYMAYGDSNSIDDYDNGNDMYMPSYSSSRASQFRAESAVTPASIKFEAVAPDNGRRRSIRDDSCKFEFEVKKGNPNQICEDFVYAIPAKLTTLERQLKLTTGIIGDIQTEQQNDNNRLVSELKNVDADTQRLRRDTDSQMHRIGQLESKVKNINPEIGDLSSIQRELSKYSRTLRSVENKELELERKIQETDKVLREVQSLKNMMVNVDSKIDKILNSNSQPMTAIGSNSRSDSYSRSDNARPTVQPTPKRRSSAQDCSYYEAYDYERPKDGIYKLDGLINPATKRNIDQAVQVFCTFDNNGKGWTVIQRRNSGIENFNRGWVDYKRGFGVLRKEFWLGLETIYSLVGDMSKNYWLQIVMEDLDGRKYTAKYRNFSLYGESRYYAIRNAVFTSGNAGNSLYININNGFSTPDRDHDRSPKYSCAKYLNSGWWFSNCGNSNLNGKYYRTGTYKGMQDGIFWGSARGRFYSFRTTEMKIRPMTDKEQRDMEDRYKPHGGRPPAVYR